MEKRAGKGRLLLLLGILLVVIDQVIKVLVKTHMTLGESIPVLGNWFQLLFVENKGMAFGLSFGAFGNIIDCLCYGLVFTESTPDAVAVLGGHYAPFMQGRVVDMFYFPLWRWPEWMPLVGGDIFFEPVFNFADSCVTVGAIYLILFHWKFFAKE